MGDPQPVYKNGVLIGYTYDGKSMTPVNKGAQEVYDKDKFIGITYDGKTMTPFEQPEPVKKKEVSGQGFWASQSASVPQSTSTKEAVINYIKEKLPAEAKTAPTTGISAVKPVKTNPFTQTREEAISHASNKLNEIMYANDDAWQDPLKAATVGAKNSATTKDALSHLGAKNLTEMSLAPDGYEAKKTLASTILGQMNDDNMTAVMLRQKAAKYDATVDGLRSINPNTVMGQGDISVGIRNAAIKSYANENPGFKKDIENAGYDINDPDLEFKLPQTKVGQIFNEYINNPNVAAYLQKENPELLPAFKATVDNMYRDNPEWGAVQIADELSKERTKRGLNEAFVNYYGKNDKEATNKIAEELYKDDPEKLALYNSRIRNHQEDYIDAPSLLSNTASGIKGIGNSMLNLVTQPFKSNKNIIDEKLEKEASNVSADPKGVLAFTSATGNVLGFLMGLGVTKNLSGLSELNSLSLATTGDIIQEAREKYPDNPVKATLSSGLNVILYRALGKNVFPVSKVGKAFSELKPEVGKIVENLANGSITKEAARQQASTLVKKAVDLVGGSAAKDVKISAELTGVQAANQLFDKLEMSDDEYKKSHPEGQLWDSFKHNLLSNAVVAGFAKYGEMKNANRAVSQSLYEAASNPKQYEREINNASVSLSYADVQEAKDNLKFIADTKKRLDAEGVKPQNQPRAIFEALQAKVKSETIPETGNKVLDKKTADEIKQHQEVQERILKGEDADTIITKAEQDKIDEQKENQIKLQRLQEDNKLSNEKFDKQLEGLDGRNPDDKLKIKEIELKRSRENEDFERESGKLKPKLTPEEAAKTITNDFYRNAIMADPEAGLKEAAQQLHSSKGEAETARKIYGDAFSDLALERYPTKEEAFAPQGITEVQLNETEEPLNWTNQDGRNKTINGRDWGEVVHEWFSNAKSNLSKFLKEKFGFAIENVNQSNWLNATKEENGLIATKQFDNGTLSLHTNGEFSFKDNKGDVTRFDKNGNVINEFSEIPQKQGITEVQPDAEGVKYWLDAADNEFGDDTKGKINFLKTLFDGNGEKAAPETSEKTKSDVKKAIEVLEQQASEPIPEPDNGKTNTEGEQQQLPPETARKIYGDAFSDLALERYPTKEEAFGTPQGITEVQPDENKVIYVQKFYPDKPNEELTERQINSVEKAISMGIEAGKSGDEIYAILNALGYAPANLSGMSENLREYLNDRVSGKDNRTFQETQSKIGNTTQEQQASEPIPEPDNGKINTEREQLPPEGGTPEPPASEPPTPEPPKPEPPKVEPEGGFVGKRKAILNRVFNGENTPQYIKDRMQEQGLDYVPVSHEESTEFAKSAIAEMGADEAIDKAESHSFPGGANTAVFTEVLNKLFDDEVNAKTPEEKLALAAKQADLYIRFDEYERKNGRDISAVNDFKKKSPLGLVMAQNEQKRTEYNDWAKKKDKSWKEYFNDLMKEPEFAKVFSEEVESKSKEIRVGERKSRREKVHKAIDDTMAKWAKKLSIDNPNDVKKAGGGDIKTILNAAGKTMKAAYDAGEAIAKVVKDAIDYISKELGHDNWPKDEFEKEWTDVLANSTKPKTKEEVNIRRLQKELEDLRAGVVKMQSEQREFSEKEKELKEQIFEAKKNLGLIPSKGVQEPNTEKLTAEELAIKSKEKELENLLQGIVKQPNDKRVISDREKELNDQIFEEKKKLGLIKSKSVKDADYGLKITETEKRIKRLEKEKEDLESGVIKQKEVSTEKPSPAQQEKIDQLKDDIFNLKKNLGLLKSKEIKEVKPEKTEEEKKVERLQKQLDDLLNGVVKDKKEKVEDSQEVKDLKDKIFEAKKNLGLVAPKGMPSVKLTPEQISIKAKEKQLEELRQGKLKQEKESRKLSEREKDLNKQIAEEKKKLGVVSEQILKRFRKKLSGLSEKEKDEVIRRSYRQIVENGGLNYDDFREIIGRVTGRSEMTPEETAKFKQLVEVSNSAAEAKSKLLAERTEKAHKEFLEAEKAASKARRELNEMIWNKPNIMQRLTSIMQLNTLGVKALIANVAYNITYQVGVRLPVSLLKTLGENVYRLYDSQYKPETNTFVSQGSFFKKMGLGIKESISQIWTGLNRKDYTQKEIYSQSIRPLHAMKDLWDYANKKKQLSGGQIVDKALQSTVGIPAEIVGRLLNVGDKPLRFGAEGAQAAVFAKQLGLKGMDFKLFLEFPKEEAYRNYIAKGLSPEEAGKKAEIVYNTIIKEGERATFQQDNLANDAISSVFEKIFGSKRSGTGSFVKALTVSPYLKIPINAWWSMYNLLNPEIAVTQSIAYARKGYLEKGKDDISSHASYLQSKYWAAHAAVGIATRAVILQLVSAGIFRPAPTEDDTKKEREGELFYEPQGTFNITKFWAYVNGNDPNSVKHSITIQNGWFGQWGAMGNTISKKYYDATAEQRDNQHSFWDAAFGGMEVEGLKEFQNSIFGGTSSMLDFINGGLSGRQYLLSQINMVSNIVDPAMFSQISRAQLPYYSTAKADGFVDELKNSMLQRSSVVRQLEGKYPPSKISIWGEPMKRPGNTFERLFGITPVNKDNFAQPIYEDAKRTGDIGFFPPSVKPEIGDKKLPIDQYNQLQTYIGQARSTLVAPYINNMAEIEVVGKKYSQLSDAYKKKTLNYLYTLGQQQGINRFLQEHPEYTKQGKSVSQQIEDDLFNSWEELKKAENQY